MNGGIERLREALYRRGGARVGARPRRPLPDGSPDVPTSFALPSEPPRAPRRPRFTARSFFAASVLFFLAAVGVAAFLIFGGVNTISTKNVDILVDGPTAVAGGDALTLTVNVVNKNAVAMKLTDLIVEYPPGTRSATDVNRELPRARVSLGEIPPGGRASHTAPAVLFGEEGKEQEILITVEYRVDGSNAIFFKEQPHTVLLSSSPMRLAIEMPAEAVSGQEFAMRIEASSNATAVIGDALLIVEYPFGFLFASASPSPAFATNVFELGDIPPGGKRIVEIRGSLAGQDGEERVFRFASGSRSSRDRKEIAAEFALATRPLPIRRPFLAVDVDVAGSAGREAVIASGRPVRIDLSYTNNLPAQLFDAEISARIAGDALDPSSVSVERGFFRSVDRTALWSRETDRALAEVNPGEGGRVSLTLAPLAYPAVGALRNPAIALEISARARRLGEAGVPEEVETLERVTLKVATDLLFSSRATYAGGPFANSGPIPPRAERPTTYTVIWTISSGSSQVNDLAVEASLPPSVRWLGAFVPTSERIVHDPARRSVRWSVGSVPPGRAGEREVAFQIEFVPSVSQVGSVPPLLGEQVAEGADQFTGTTARAVRAALTTDLKTEAGFPAGGGTVGE